jgi:prepilin-type N-terminal cleavage/methylation domain-containing protein
MVQAVQKKNGFYRNLHGFTFIELIVAIALIAAMATIVVPNLWRQTPDQERESFVAKLNAFTGLVWYNALVTGKLHKILIDLNAGKLFAEVQTDQVTGQGELKFAPMELDYQASELVLEPRFRLREIYINGRNTMDGSNDKFWFYISSDGLAQPVTLNFADQQVVPSSENSNIYSLVLNPFSAQFKLSDEEFKA